MAAQHRQWLVAAGVEVGDGVPVEIGPRLALDAEELARKAPPRMRVTEATYLEERIAN
jgi:hypothetical protein